MGSMKHSFNILSDYEVGRCISSIEAVSRGTKPVAEIGNRKLEDIEQLKADLRACLELAREPNVKGFVLQQEANRWSFGFYSESWVEEAILFIDRVELPEYHRHWISGLLFGYSPDAIQRFLSCASTAQGAREPLDDTLSKGGTSLPCSGRSRTHSTWNDIFQTVS